jgi:STE24 endopeptidase
VREHAYGMATQDFGAWFGEQLIALAVSMIVVALVVPLLYAVLRRTGTRWWMWGSGIATGVLALGMLVGPVWIDPLFNTYKPVEDGPIKRTGCRPTRSTSSMPRGRPRGSAQTCPAWAALPRSA